MNKIIAIANLVFHPTTTEYFSMSSLQLFRKLKIEPRKL